MIVELIARTTIVPGALRRMGYVLHPKGSVTDGDELIEACGRGCYHSWDRPNPGTATNEGYLANIINQRHFSVLQHASYTFWIAKVSRALTHELVRHHFLSPSQASQRFMDESEGEFVLPPEIVARQDVVLDIALMDAHHEATLVYEKIFEALTAAGVPRKRARQAARYALPNGHETELTISGNVTAWREFIQKRRATHDDGEPYADLEIFELATLILKHLHHEVPNAVQDLWDEYLKTPPWPQGTGTHTAA